MQNDLITAGLSLLILQSSKDLVIKSLSELINLKKEDLKKKLNNIIIKEQQRRNDIDNTKKKIESNQNTGSIFSSFSNQILNKDKKKSIKKIIEKEEVIIG